MLIKIEDAFKVYSYWAYFALTYIRLPLFFWYGKLLSFSLQHLLQKLFIRSLICWLLVRIQYMWGLLTNKNIIDFSISFSNDFFFSWFLQHQKTLVIFIAYLNSAIIKAFWMSHICVDVSRIQIIKLLIHP